MALESPLFHSPGGLVSAFSPYTNSPGSPALPKSPRFPTMVSDSTGQQESNPDQESAAATPAVAEPLDEAPGPANEASHDETADKTNTDDKISNVDDTTPLSSDDVGSAGSVKSEKTVNTIDTAILTGPRSPSDETPQSVIHAPQGFKEFDGKEEQRNASPPLDHRRTPPPSQRSDFAPTKSTTLQVHNGPSDKASPNSPVSPPPISTAVASSKFPMEGVTPRAQTRQEVEAGLEQKGPQQGRSSALEGCRPTAHVLCQSIDGRLDIPEAQSQEHYTEEEHPADDGLDSTAHGNMREADEEVKALKTALDECWTLCNTLAGLSSIHRQRIFNFAGTGDMQEQAWKSCWKLCQKLYDSRDDDHDIHVRPTLHLCREFCQSLFEVRQRDNEVADSVLRVSFELNNHLYNTHDRNLPEAFRERTLDFYITLCHRLMKQRSGLAEETDSLLRACWSLAEMLFSLRQNKREGKSADEELLGSAVQACWELCDLFREGWTQVRPERGTPRPSQTTFSQAFNQMKQQSDLGTVHERHTEPETPTTIFEDTAISPDGEDNVAAPNILVLGVDNDGTGTGQRWSSTASALSGYSQGSADTSSTATTTAMARDDLNLTRLKILIVKAAMNAGFQRTAGQTLNTFVKSLPSTSFGPLPWQMSVLEKYKNMILADPFFRSPINLPSSRASAADVARSIQWMGRSGQYAFLRELFALVFGFHTEEAERKAHVFIQT